MSTDAEKQWQRARYAGRKSMGLCVCCGKRVGAAKVLCIPCTTQKSPAWRAACAASYIKRKDARQCPRCGVPLHDDVDAGKLCCQNCSTVSVREQRMLGRTRGVTSS